ncbi:hypothetical protein V6N13_101540 [Hibiscus sabdariffa]|uniref:TF-B3 domain-containing protein n=1 Tax=Hibiscus sabdariffa TaxID=183260 RepID=A0ABR2QM59_9ROSI
MAIQVVLFKTLTQTDIEKRLSVPTKKKMCFLDFGGQHNVGFKAMDRNGKLWQFSCSRRKTRGYPKPVLSRGWLPFVRCWKLEIGDKVIFYRQGMDRAGKGDYLIDVIRREPLPPTLIQNHDADKVMEIASYTNDEGETTITSNFTDVAMANIEEAATITSDFTDVAMANIEEAATMTSDFTDVAMANIEEAATMTSNFTDVAMANIEEAATMTSSSTDQAITYDQTEGLQNQHGFMFEFISLKPDIAVSERKSINFFELGSQEQSEKDNLCILTLLNNSTDEVSVTSSTAPYFEFL